MRSPVGSHKYCSFGELKNDCIIFSAQRSEINEALQCLEEAVNKFQVPPSAIMRSSLLLLKSACDAKNIPFPYAIPVSKHLSFQTTRM